MPSEPPGVRPSLAQTCGPSMAGTPATGTSSLPHITDLAAQLTSTRLVKNYTDAISRLLIAVNSNYTTKTLANVLLTASFKDKVPKIKVSIMQAIGFLMV